MDPGRANVRCVLIESRNGSKHATPGHPAKAARNRWPSVEIIAPASACSAASACRQKRFLSSEAPRLPLSGCDAAVCKCKYRHFEDRRAGDRRADEAMPKGKRLTVNRRAKQGRRADD